MNNTELFKKIGGIISELRDQHTYLTEHPENLNEFELELFRANSGFLSEHIDIFRKLNYSLTQPAVPPVQEISKTEPESPPAPKPVNTPVEEAKVAEVTEKEWPFSIEQYETPKEEVPIPEETTKPAPTVNELLSANVTNSGTTLASQLNKPASDLKSLINLNDKLLFVKDLFNGYSLAYNEAIDLLNRFSNFESANNFLITNYSVKNKWEEKKTTADKFYELLKKRFGN